jgi:hypothetical protein
MKSSRRRNRCVAYPQFTFNHKKKGGAFNLAITPSKTHLNLGTLRSIRTRGNRQISRLSAGKRVVDLGGASRYKQRAGRVDLHVNWSSRGWMSARSWPIAAAGSAHRCRWPEASSREPLGGSIPAPNPIATEAVVEERGLERKATTNLLVALARGFEEGEKVLVGGVQSAESRIFADSSEEIPRLCRFAPLGGK